MDVRQAVNDLYLAYGVVRDAGVDEHYHLTNDKELTILTSDDLPFYLEGAIRKNIDPTHVDVEIERDTDHSLREDMEIIRLYLHEIDGDGLATIVYRVRCCTDPTCEKVLQDYWL